MSAPVNARPEERIAYRVFYVIGCLLGLGLCLLGLGMLLWAVVSVFARVVS